MLVWSLAVVAGFSRVIQDHYMVEYSNWNRDKSKICQNSLNVNHDMRYGEV